MQTDITRQVSASVYTNTNLRNKIFEFVKDPYHSVVESYGLVTDEVLKHVFNARKWYRNYYQKLLIPSIIFWSVFLSSIFSFGASQGGGRLGLSFLAFLICFVIVLVHNLRLREFLRDQLHKDSYNPNFGYDSNNYHLIEKFNRKTSENLVIYSGYSPFVGSGIDIGGWSFVVDIDKGKNNLEGLYEPEDFDISEIYEAVDKEIESLNISNLTVTDKVFINGKKVRDNKELLPNKLSHPVNKVSEEFLKSVMEEPNTNARLYRVIQVVDWEGDIVLTSFLRFQKSDTSLFVENNYYLLPPISESLKEIDAIKEKSGIRESVNWILEIFINTIKHSVSSIVNVFGYIGDIIGNIFGSQEEALRKIVKSSPDFDYGAFTSIREAVSQRLYSQHFQKLDKERYFKMIEKRVLNTLTDFLDQKNIDTAEFKEREANILNNGILITGGNLEADNIAVGTNSQISNIFKNPIKQ